MKIDKSKLDAVTSLSDHDFSELLGKILIQSGADEKITGAALSAAPLLKARLARASDSDLERIAKLIGNKNAAELLGSDEK